MKTKFHLLILFSLMLLSGCAATNDASPPKTIPVAPASEQPPDQNADSNDGGALDFTAQYIRKGSGLENEEYPSTQVIRSTEELTAYDGTLPYDASFFEAHSLLLVRLMESSGSIRHMVTEVTSDSRTLTVSIDRLRPEIGTMDMAAWHILIELPPGIPDSVDLAFTDVPVSLE
jgi:hypothetical protein